MALPATQADQRGDWPDPFYRLLRAGIELLCHAVMAGLILTAMKGLERLMNLYWGPGKLLFDRFSLGYLFDGADLLLLFGFLVIGTWAVLGAYYGKHASPPSASDGSAAHQR